MNIPIKNMGKHPWQVRFTCWQCNMWAGNGMAQVAQGLGPHILGEASIATR